MHRKKNNKKLTATGRKSPTPSGFRPIVLAWVMCTLTALLGELAMLALILLRAIVEPSERLGALAVILVLTAAFSGMLGLTMLPFVLRSGRERIPRQAVIVSVAISLLPLLALVGLFLGASGN
ncbi:MAG TPA: hypothetical protein QF761_13555 [Pirellulales bacterium]|jgi:hypothetical protein|nr:hypothetical protein [Pirellulales bacterium]